ncbi:metal-dependent hydrolase [Paludibaculum fermentans]|uniref:Metal-dependent hydrolase n=1 Tax=Paludibaculum fermentans TaxID=1473598 RepID=A0A7S7SKI6_PALFE|nr:metal-dependent hydrolase [Paludibaculum fermentans]QOY88374.1 metal-dependent hydrolase [Paludibaculum fermentans]
MDIVAHGLCTAAAAIFVNRRPGPAVRLGWAVFFGVLPDLASFTVPAVLRIWWRVTGVTTTLLPQPGGPRLDWVFGLYNCVHSLLIFGLAFASAWIVARRPVWELLGWLLHIVIDMLTHRGWFAIQFLWPVSAAHLDGIPWETGWLLAATYAALAGIFILLWRTRSQAAQLAIAHREPH